MRLEELERARVRLSRPGGLAIAETQIAELDERLRNFGTIEATRRHALDQRARRPGETLLAPAGIEIGFGVTRVFEAFRSRGFAERGSGRARSGATDRN